MTRTRVTITLLISLVSAHGQLHLITGSPMPTSSQRFGSSLLQVREDGTVKAIADIAPPSSATGQGGVGAVFISYDLGLAVISSDRTVVLDLEKAAVVKSCAPIIGPAHSTWLYEWLVNSPTRGGVLADEYYNSEDHRSILMGTLLDVATECEKSHIMLEPNDLSSAAVSGRIVIADAGQADYAGLYVSVHPDGKLEGTRDGISFPYSHEVPASQISGLKSPYVTLLINNSQIMVLGFSDKNNDRRVLAVRKRDDSWIRIPLPSLHDPAAVGPPLIPTMRGFGHFIAMAEQQPKTVQSSESAGKSEWRRGSSKAGPDTELLFRRARFVFPGRLHLYDVDTGKNYSFSTNQGDSEILLVDNNTVYYRASDRLYSVDINGDEIGRPRLLATGEAIRDAHWAFIKR